MAPESSVKSDFDLFLKYSFPLWILCSVRAYLRNCSQKTNIFCLLHLLPLVHANAFEHLTFKVPKFCFKKGANPFDEAPIL